MQTNAEKFLTVELLVQEIMGHGFERSREAIQELIEASGSDETATKSLKDLLRCLNWEGHHLQSLYPGSGKHHDGGQYLIQALRERAHHQSYDVLRESYEAWLKKQDASYFKSHDAWRYPINEAQLLGISIDNHTVGDIGAAISADGNCLLTNSQANVMEAATAQLWNTKNGLMQRQVELADHATGRAISADGSRIFLACFKDVHLFNAATGETIHVFKGHEKRIRGLSLAADESSFATVAEDNTIRLWNPTSGSEMLHLVHNARMDFLALSGDGSRLIAASPIRDVWVWATATKSILYHFDLGRAQIGNVAISADGSTACASLWDGSIRLWDLHTGSELRHLTGHQEKIQGIALSADGKRVLSGSFDKTMRLWNSETGEELKRIVVGSFISKVGLTANGQKAFSLGDKAVKLWDLTVESKETSRVVQLGQINQLASSADAELVLTGSSDKTMQLWKVATGGKILEIDHSNIPQGNVQTSIVSKTPDGLQSRPAANLMAYVSYVAITGDGEEALSCTGDFSVRLWDLKTSSLAYTFPVKGNGIVLSSDAKRLLIVVNHNLHLWDFQARTELNVMSGHHSGIVDVGLSANGDYAVSAATTGIIMGPRDGIQIENAVRVWDTRAGVEIQSYEDHKGYLKCAAISADGRYIASGAADKMIFVRDVQTKELLHRLEGHSMEITCLAFSPDGALVLSGAADKTLRLWDRASGKLLSSLYCAHAPRRVTFASGKSRQFFAALGSIIQVFSIEKA